MMSAKPSHKIPSVEEKIVKEQMQMLYQSLPYNVIFHIVGGFIVCAVLWTVADRYMLLSWWSVVLVLSLLRLATYAYYRVSAVDRNSTQFWINVYAGGAVLTGASWGYAGVSIIPHDLLSYELFVGFVIAGMAMGAVPILSAVRTVYLGFSLSAATPYIIHTFSHEGTIYMAVAVIHCLFLILMIIMSFHMHKMIRESLLLRFYNIDLVEKLQKSNDLLVDEVDAHKQTEGNLRENEQRLVALANASSEGIVLHQAGEIKEINQGVLEMTGYSIDDLLNSKVENIFSEQCRDSVLSYIKSPSSDAMEAQICAKNNVCLPIEIRAGYVPYRGEYIAFVVIRDITTYKELLKAQEMGRRKAEEADRSKTEFLAAVSHELRTPLNAVMGFTQLLQETKLTPEQEDYLNMSLQSANQLLSLINDLLDLSRIETGHFNLEVITFNLMDELSDVLSLMSIKLAESGNMINVHFDDDLPIQVTTDPTRLRQILINLLGNAIKFTTDGAIHFSVYQQDKNICFSIKDSGKGIPEDKLDFIFGKFNQIDSSISRAHGGVGLGLAICKRLVELMEGEISVESKVNEGTAFHVALPINKVLINNTKSEGNNIISDVDHKVMNILLVEDDKTNQMIATTMLKKMGHQVTVAEDGQQAIDACMNENKFEIILMDIQMPVMDGITASKQLREKGITVPIVAMTANAMTGDREMYIREGLSDYISKPIYKDILSELLAKYK